MSKSEEFITDLYKLITIQYSIEKNRDDNNYRRAEDLERAHLQPLIKKMTKCFEEIISDKNCNAGD